MRKKLGKLLASIGLAIGVCATGGLFSVQASAQETDYKEPALSNIKNVILLIGDGMGPTHVQAGELFKGSKLAIHTMPHAAYSLTRSANSSITDSAAGGTAIATGVRTNNGYVGIDSTGKELTTIMDVALAQGKRTGIVTTDVMSGATPMSFAAHYNNRNASAELLASAAQSGVNLMAATIGDSVSVFEENGYTKLASVDDISSSQEEYIVGAYNIKASAAPQSANANSVAFDRLVRESIEYLSKDEDGFVLMAEGARIDKESHSNNFFNMIEEMIAFDNAVDTALTWAKGRNDTLVIVTADHETGGLALANDVTSENIIQENKHSWSSKDHTATNVYCNVYGTDVGFLRFSSENKQDLLKNTDIFQMMKSFVTGCQEASVTVKKTWGGSVEMDAEKFYFGQKVKIQLNVNEGYRVKSFKINGVESLSKFNADGTMEYTIDSGTVLFAPTFATKPAEFEITYDDLGQFGSWGDNPTKVEKGKKLVVEVQAKEGYEVEKVYFGEQEMTKNAGGRYEITVQNAGTVRVTFKQTTPQENNGNSAPNALGCGGTISGGLVTIALAIGVVTALKKKEN